MFLSDYNTGDELSGWTKAKRIAAAKKAARTRKRNAKAVKRKTPTRAHK